MGGGASTLGNKIGTIYQVPDEDINDSLAVRPASKSIAQSRLRSMLFLFTKGIINSTKTLPVGGSEYPGLMQGAHAISKNGVGDQMVPKLEIPVPSDTPSPPARNAGMRASAVMMAKLILDTVPAFKSYTEEEPTTEDLAMANRVRLLLSSPSKYLEFYTTVYEILYDSSTMRSFPVRTITFKNTFLSELMKLIVTEGSCKASFADRVQLFGNRYKAEGIEVIEYGQFGEAIITAMRKVEKQPQDLWPKVYSRFLRTLVPHMIIQSSKAIMEDSPLPRTLTAPLFSASLLSPRAHSQSHLHSHSHSHSHLYAQQLHHHQQQQRQMSNTFSTQSDSTRTQPSVDDALEHL